MRKTMHSCTSACAISLERETYKACRLSFLTQVLSRIRAVQFSRNIVAHNVMQLKTHKLQFTLPNTRQVDFYFVVKVLP